MKTLDVCLYILEWTAHSRNALHNLTREKSSQTSPKHDPDYWQEPAGLLNRPRSFVYDWACIIVVILEYVGFGT